MIRRHISACLRRIHDHLNPGLHWVDRRYEAEHAVSERWRAAITAALTLAPTSTLADVLAEITPSTWPEGWTDSGHGAYATADIDGINWITASVNVCSTDGPQPRYIQAVGAQGTPEQARHAAHVLAGTLARLDRQRTK